MQRVVMNLGIGLGGVAGGFIASESFRALFVLDALTFVAYAAVLTVFVHDPARREERPERPGSYRTVFRHKVFMALMVANSLYIGAGIAQLEILPAYAKNEAGVSEQGIGWLFFVNTIVIVLLQLPTTRLAEGRRRVPLLALLGAVSAAAWLLVPLSGLWLTGAAAFALLAVAVSIFALGECLHGAVQPTLVVDLADPRLIGRYMAISALSWQVGFMVGPAVGGVLLRRLSERPLARDGVGAPPRRAGLAGARARPARGAAARAARHPCHRSPSRFPSRRESLKPPARLGRLPAMPTLEDPLSTDAEPASHPADAAGRQRGRRPRPLSAAR